MPVSPKRLKLLLILLLCVGVLLGLLLRAHSPLPEVIPQPNGYDDFLAASWRTGEDVTNWNRMSRQDLASLVMTNTEALRRLRVGLRKECKVQPYTLTPSTPGHAITSRRLDLLAQALAAEARLALLEGRTNAAVAVCLDWVRYGQERGRGGLVFDDGCGSRIQSNALAVLATLAQSVDPAVAQETAVNLKVVMSRSESAQDVWNRHLDWSRRGRFGWFERAYLLVNRQHLKRVKRNLEVRHDDLKDDLRRVIRDFAAREGASQ